MSRFLNKVRGYKNNLNQFDREILDILLKISPELVDEENSKISIVSDFIIFSYKSGMNKCCSFDLYLGQNESENRINFFIGVGAEVLNYETYKGEEDFKLVRDVLIQILRSSIIETKKFFENKLSKATYEIESYNNGKLEKMKFVWGKHFIFFWESHKIQKEVKVFESWLKY